MYYDREDEQLAASLDVTESVLNVLSNLHYLHMRIGPVGLKIKAGSEELEFNTNLHFFNEIFDTKLPRTPRTFTDRLKRALVQYIHSTEVLKSISKRLPCTKYLKLFDFRFDKDQNANTILDLADSHLQYFMFDIGKILNPSNDKQGVILQVEETQYSEIRHCTSGTGNQMNMNLPIPNELVLIPLN